MIAVAAGGVTEVVLHGHDSWRLKPGDTTALTNAIGTLRAGPAPAQHLAERGAE